MSLFLLKCQHLSFFTSTEVVKTLFYDVLIPLKIQKSGFSDLNVLKVQNIIKRRFNDFCRRFLKKVYRMGSPLSSSIFLRLVGDFKMTSRASFKRRFRGQSIITPSLDFYLSQYEQGF